MNKLLVLYSCTIITACTANFLKNNESTPEGFQKIDFSPKQNPSELIRNSLDQSTDSLASVENIFSNYNTNLVMSVQNYINLNNIINQSFDEKSLINTISIISPYLSKDKISKVVSNIENTNIIFNATPMNTLDDKIISDNYGIFYKIITEAQKQDDIFYLNIFDKNGNEIDKNKLNIELTSLNYYARNLFQSLIFPIKDEKSKNSWEFFIQCISGNITDASTNIKYNLTPWPRVTILQLNPNTKISTKFSFHKNSLFLIEDKFKAVNNLYQNTVRSFIVNDNLLPPNSSLKNQIISIPNPLSKDKSFNATFYQEGMSKFFSRFMSSNIENFNIFYNFSSWQVKINKSWFGANKNLDSNYTIVEDNKNISLNYLNYLNTPVNQNYSKDFQPNGIHYININNTNEVLLEIPNNIEFNKEILDETKITNFCSELLSQKSND